MKKFDDRKTESKGIDVRGLFKPPEEIYSEESNQSAVDLPAVVKQVKDEMKYDKNKWKEENRSFIETLLQMERTCDENIELFYLDDPIDNMYKLIKLNYPKIVEDQLSLFYPNNKIEVVQTDSIKTFGQTVDK